MGAKYLPQGGRAGALSPRACRRPGFSLVEVMVATTISLVILGAAVSLFGYIGGQTSAARGTIELNDRLRSAVDRLKRDLAGVTVTACPWQSASQGAGYIEIEKCRPLTGKSTYNGMYSYVPDPQGATVGDIISFTTHTTGAPFAARAKVNGQTTIIESLFAEVNWFVAQPVLSPPKTTNPPTFNLYRHMLVVRPDFGQIGSAQYLTPSSYTDSSGRQQTAYILAYDISAHQGLSTPGNPFLCNSLTDLAYREFRFNHSQWFYPFMFDPGFPGPVPQGSGDPRYGEDLVLSDVLSFDVKLWDPLVEVKQDADGRPLVPSDPGYAAGSSMSPKVYGAYVDLNYSGRANDSYFSGPYYGAGQKSSLVNTGNGPFIYDTWSTGYEYFNHSGVEFMQSSNDVAYGQSKNAVTGFAYNGSAVGDPTLRSTCPPYPVPLRGVQIKIRVWDRGTRQVREATITESFLPD